MKKNNDGTSPSRRRRFLLPMSLLLVVIVAASTQLTLFVVQPIGSVPDGRTILIQRLEGGTFIDSAGAMCEGIQGNVNLLCRGMILARVGENSHVYLRLPYSQTLYMLSTGGKAYDR